MVFILFLIVVAVAAILMRTTALLGFLAVAIGTAAYRTFLYDESQKLLFLGLAILCVAVFIYGVIDGVKSRRQEPLP